MKRDTITCSGLMQDQHGGYIEMEFETATAHLDLDTAKKLADEINVYIDLAKRGWPSTFSSSVNLVYPPEQESESLDTYQTPVDPELAHTIKKFFEVNKAIRAAVINISQLWVSLIQHECRTNDFSTAQKIALGDSAYIAAEEKLEELEEERHGLEEDLSAGSLNFYPDQDGVWVSETPSPGALHEKDSVFIEWRQLERVIQTLAAFNVHLTAQEKENHEKF